MSAEVKMTKEEKALTMLYWVKIQKTGLWWPGMLLSRNKWPKALVKKKLAGKHKVVRLFHLFDSSQEYLVVRKSLLRPFGKYHDLLKDSGTDRCFQSAVLEAQIVYQQTLDELKAKDNLIKQDKDLDSKDCSSGVLLKKQITTSDPVQDHVKHQCNAAHNYSKGDEADLCIQGSDGVYNSCGPTKITSISSSCCIEKIPGNPAYAPVSPGDMGHATNQGHFLMSCSSTAVPGLDVETGAECVVGGSQSLCGAVNTAISVEANADGPYDESGAGVAMKLDGEAHACPNANGDHHSLCEPCGQGERLLCCNGVGCKNTYKLSCLEPHLGDLSREAWYCPDCRNRHLAICCTVDTIWDVRYDQGSTNFSTAVNCSNLFPAPIVPQGGGDSEGMYFVKWKGRSHIHNSWISENELLKAAPKKLATFKKNCKQGKVLKWDPEWIEPHRVLGKRKFVKGAGNVWNSQENGEWLFKWKGLGYDQCTWETADSGVLATEQVKELIECYNKRCEAALDRSHPNRDEKKAKLHPIVDFGEQPEWIQGVRLFPHQLAVLNKLRNCHRSCQNGIVVYEASQERISSTVAFLLSIFEEFKTVRPALIVGPSDKVAVWEMELCNLASKLNCVAYVGSRDARDVIQQYEFGECMKADIVVTTFDIVNLDIDFLKKYNWEIMIVDEGSRPKASKTYLRLLNQLNAIFRLIFLSGPLKGNIDEALQLLAFVNHGNDPSIADSADGTISIGLSVLLEKLNEYNIHEFKDEACSSSIVEYWVPVQMPLVQVHEYCNLLLQNYEVLQSGQYSHQDISLHDVLLKLRECCNHPYLVSSSLQGSIVKHIPAQEWLDAGIKASGKLHILDMFLCHLHSKGERVLIVTQPVLRRVTKEVSLMDILEDYLRQRFGVNSYERVESGLSVTTRQAAFQRFNVKGSGPFVLLLDRNVKNVSYRLTALDGVIIFSSNWDPSKDTSYVKQLCLNSQSKSLPIYRMYTHFSIEEGILIASRNNIALDPSTNMKNQTQVCQQVLRWHAKCLLELDRIYDQEAGPLGTDIDLSKQSLVIKSSFDGNSMINWDPLKVRAVLTLPPDNVVSSVSDPMLQAIFSTKDMPASSENITRSLYGTFSKDFYEDIEAKNFWRLLLEERYSERWGNRRLGSHGKSQRSRKRVHYAALDDESTIPLEDGRKKRRRKQGVKIDIDAGATQVETSKRPVGFSSIDTLAIDKDGQLLSATGLAQSTEPMENLETDCQQRSDFCNHEGHVRDPLNPQLRQQKHLYKSMMQELASLSVALNLHESISSRANELLLYVLSNLQVKDHPSLLHAVEISLCLIAAEELGFDIDVGRTLVLANTVLNTNLDEQKVKLIFTKISKQIKSTPSISATQHTVPCEMSLQNKDSSQSAQMLANTIEELRKYQKESIKRLMDSQKQQLLIFQQKASEARNILNGGRHGLLSSGIQPVCSSLEVMGECNVFQNRSLEMVIKEREVKLKSQQKDADDRLNRYFSRLFQETNDGQIPHGEVVERALLFQHEMDKEHETFLCDLKNFFASALQNEHQVPDEVLAAGTLEHCWYNLAPELDNGSVLVDTLATVQVEPASQTSSVCSVPLLHDSLHSTSPLGQQGLVSEQVAEFTQTGTDHLEQHIPATASCSQMLVERSGCDSLDVLASQALASMDGSRSTLNLPITVQHSTLIPNNTGAGSGQSHAPRTLNGVSSFGIPPALDPLQNEEIRLKEEQEKLWKAFENQNAQIKQEYELEESALKKKYEARLQEKERDFGKRYKGLQRSITKIENNRRLADALRAKDAFAAGAARVEVTSGVRLGTGLAFVPNHLPVHAHNGRVVEQTTFSNAELSWSTATTLLGRQAISGPTDMQLADSDMIGANQLSDFHACNVPTSFALQDFELRMPGCATIPMHVTAGLSVPTITTTAFVGAPVYTASVMTASCPGTATETIGSPPDPDWVHGTASETIGSAVDSDWVRLCTEVNGFLRW